MKFTASIEEILIPDVEKVELAWWIEIITLEPHCTYYFGPFISAAEAESARIGYIEDLEQEGVREMKIQIAQCQPNDLTIYKDEWSESASLSWN